MIKELIKLADELDSRGLSKVANKIDNILIKISSSLIAYVAEEGERLLPFVLPRVEQELGLSMDEFYKLMEGYIDQTLVENKSIYDIFTGNMDDMTAELKRVISSVIREYATNTDGAYFNLEADTVEYIKSLCTFLVNEREWVSLGQKEAFADEGILFPDTEGYGQRWSDSQWDHPEDR